MPVSCQRNREIEKRVSYFLHYDLCLKVLKSSRKVFNELSREVNCHAKDRSRLPCTVKYRSKDRPVPNNRCCENAANYGMEQNFFKKLRKAKNLDEIRLHYFCTILYMQFLSQTLMLLPIRNVVLNGCIYLQGRITLIQKTLIFPSLCVVLLVMPCTPHRGLPQLPLLFYLVFSMFLIVKVICVTWLFCALLFYILPYGSSS